MLGIFLTLFYAYLVDKYGHRITFMSIGNLLTFLSFIIFISLPFYGYVGYYSIAGIMTLANAKSIAGATVWPIFPLIVKRE